MTSRKFKVPHTLVILFSMVVLAQLLTYVIPAGSFDRVETESGRMQVVPGSFQLTPDVPAVSPFAALTAIPKGFSGAHEIIFFVFIIGGMFAVLRATGTLEAAMASLLRRWGKQPFWLIAGGITMFAFGSATVGFGEEYYPFVPVLVSLCIALGYDRMTAIGIIMIGYGAGYGPAFINPFTTLIAQDIAGLEPGSGMWFRLICFVVFVGLGIHHVWSYAKRVGNDPSASLVADVKIPAGAAIPSDESAHALNDLPPMTRVQKLIMLAIGAAMVLLFYGMLVWKWGLFEMQGLFAGLTLVIAAIARMSPNETAAEFSTGAGSLTSVALLIGVARAIQVVLDEGGVVDTMVHGISIPVSELPGAVSAVAMFFVQSLANFFIPSGSGQAYVTMPIMAPLADIVGVSRQVAVLAFQFGDGFSNILIPTQYVLIGILAMAGIPYDRWLRFVMPFMIKVAVAASAALAIAVVIGYS
ncbi:MAG: TIGR00366 family protein [Woeseiaceae bacterium]|nr:TIGR00366 family protein [Woeseiaceae bacterium]